MTVAEAPEVVAAAGKLRGTLEPGVAVFRGIPYAEAPVGALFDTRPSITADPEQVSRLIWRDHSFSALPLSR